MAVVARSMVRLIASDHKAERDATPIVSKTIGGSKGKCRASASLHDSSLHTWQPIADYCQARYGFGENNPRYRKVASACPPARTQHK
eukprot:3517376-Pleurochrysis_carterae.AAC.2